MFRYCNIVTPTIPIPPADVLLLKGALARLTPERVERFLEEQVMADRYKFKHVVVVQPGPAALIHLKLDEPPYNFPYREVFNWTHRSLAYPMHVYVWHSNSPMCRLGRLLRVHVSTHNIPPLAFGIDADLEFVMHLRKGGGIHLSGIEGACTCRPATLLATCKHPTWEYIRVANDHACTSAKFNDSIRSGLH
jgi:hypothetical protein